MREALQHMAILQSIPLEEHLFGTEYGRHTIHRHPTMAQDMEVVIPELILYEESLHGPHCPQEPASIRHSIDREITHQVSPIIMLPHLIPRGREECQQYLPVRIHPAIFLHDRSALLKLSQRSSMEPHILRIRINMSLQISHGEILSAPHSPHFGEELRSDINAELEDIEEEVIQVCNV